MRKPNFSKAVLWVTAISPLLFTACVDDSYDLAGDIDMTVTVGGNLSIPGSGTEEFTLEDIMDLEDPENSILQTDENGNYMLLKSSSEETEVDIDGVTIDAPTCDPTYTVLEFDAPVSVGEEVESRVENVTVDFSFAKNDVTPDVTSITSALVDGTANLTLGFDQISGGVDRITLKKGFKIEISMEGQTTANTISFALDGNASGYEIMDNAPQTIKFTEDKTIRNGETLRIPIRFEEIQNFPQGQGLYAREHFRMDVNIIANGWATTPGFSAGNIRVNLVNGAEVSGIALEKVTGKVDPEIDIDIDPVTIEDVPDFLNEDNNNLDIKNPCIKLVISNTAPVDVNLTATLARVGGGSDFAFNIGNQDLSSTNCIIIRKGNGEGSEPVVTTYYLSRENMGIADDDANHTYYITLGEDLYNLIRTIPDEIRLENVEAKALDKEYIVNLGPNGARYNVNTTYELNAPLEFGPRLEIVYEDTINDWSGDIEDISIRKAIVEMDALNGIPLNFSVSATAIDVDGNEYPNVTVTPVEGFGTIAAGNKQLGEAATPTESKIRLEIACESGVMDNLDGLIFTLTAKADNALQNVVLNKNMTLQLNNIRIRIENGVTVDMN